MGSFSEFPAAWRVYLRAYPWHTINPVPHAPLRKRLSECRVALVSSAGFHLPDQAPFDPKARGGDVTFRELSADTDLSLLLNNHRSKLFDHTAMEADPNLAFPLDRLHELADAGVIGAVAPRHLSFMGSILAPKKLISQTAPLAAEVFVEDQVDLALLVPV